MRFKPMQPVPRAVSSRLGDATSKVDAFLALPCELCLEYTVPSALLKCPACSQYHCSRCCRRDDLAILGRHLLRKRTK